MLTVGDILTKAAIAKDPAESYRVDEIRPDGAVVLKVQDVVITPAPEPAPVPAPVPADPVSQLLMDAKALPAAEDVAPGRLGQLIAAVEFAQGRKMRPGSPTLEARIEALQEAVAALDVAVVV